MEFHFGMTKQFWSWRVGMVIQQRECTWYYQTVHLKLVKTGNSVLGIVYHNLKAKQNTVSASEVRDHSREEARQLLGAGLDRLAGLIAPQVAAEVSSSLPWRCSHRCTLVGLHPRSRPWLSLLLILSTVRISFTNHVRPSYKTSAAFHLPTESAKLNRSGVSTNVPTSFPWDHFLLLFFRTWC